jgi:hypothetical protein
MIILCCFTICLVHLFNFCLVWTEDGCSMLFDSFSSSLFCHYYCLVGSNSLLQPGMCDIPLFYLKSHPVATSLFLIWTPRTFTCFWWTSTSIGKSLYFYPTPSTCLRLLSGVSLYSVCRLVCHYTFCTFCPTFSSSPHSSGSWR